MRTGLSNPVFQKLCEESYNYMIKTSGSHIPGRLLGAIYYNLELLSLDMIGKFFQSGSEKTGVLRAYAYSLYRLLSESDRNAVPLLVKILQDQGKLFLEELSQVPETAILLFPLSQNIEPYKEYLTRKGLKPEELSQLVVELALSLEEKILNNWPDPDEKAFTALHLSRALAEVSRTVYSLGLELPQARRLLKCGPKEPTYRCILGKAMNLADTIIEGAEIPEIPLLGYIQVTSTITRTDLWRDRDTRNRVQRKLGDAKRILEKANYEQLIRYEALSLEGSYYYNSGWLSAVEEDFAKAAENFKHAYRSFSVLKRNNTEFPLGFLRGVYVSLWNYYLMWFDHDLQAGNEIGEEKLEDAECWGRRTGTLIVKPPLPGLSWKLGVHAFYAYALSAIASKLRGHKPHLDGQVLQRMPERIRYTIELALSLLSGDTSKALEKAEKANRKKLRPIILDLLKALSQGEQGEHLSRLVGREDTVMAENRLTVREKPVLAYIREAIASSDEEKLRRGIALLALYTL